MHDLADAELRQLYQESLLHHSRHPCNFGELAPPMREARGYNPLCGDKITVQLREDNDRLEAIAFSGSGCAISLASASLMTEAVKGMTRRETEELFAAFTALCLGAEQARATPLPARHEDLNIFAGVREYPMRVKCATLPWHTLRAVLEQRETATTE
ncbi:MAG: SUF system NifU family Fe-S cluster assembly protein [Alphaproteobacteria bacterium]|nr:SUF system NifU family Fe-S cluster assembly protein [Alphaproteobacteria bacterium]MDA7982817.1 SUF system NifU family Fe-S cluster assembly protein [Alphaproteobacteria bacterium]MDA7988381.1 SUF system NifU family Fe-S cluster assembly protein [Alphaproteobacteria bacterium]MDA8008678.1 SUF system NifU family Fe-S cluster assembly protein [Alphaproteobacteria bacterium]MDA8032428.1 SUF system NifU family Fe-S cluster assembly protein [Alphaproteobacteria bacterium]